MGDCKNEVKKINDVVEKADDTSVLGRFRSRRKKRAEKDESFADTIERADRALSKIIATKEAELANEHGEEVKNRKALSILTSMAFHLEMISELAEEYGE
jgi:fructose-1,6-bisphosphatase/inositol monophosphatase family enzyme